MHESGEPQPPGPAIHSQLCDLGRLGNLSDSQLLLLKYLGLSPEGACKNHVHPGVVMVTLTLTLMTVSTGRTDPTQGFLPLPCRLKSLSPCPQGRVGSNASRPTHPAYDHVQESRLLARGWIPRNTTWRGPHRTAQTASLSLSSTPLSSVLLKEGNLQRCQCLDTWSVSEQQERS